MAFRQIYLTTNKESIYLLPNTIAPICPLLFTQYSENSRAGWITEQSKQLPQRYPSFEQPWVQNTVTGKSIIQNTVHSSCKDIIIPWLEVQVGWGWRCQSWWRLLGANSSRAAFDVIFRFPASPHWHWNIDDMNECYDVNSTTKNCELGIYYVLGMAIIDCWWSSKK